LEVPTCRPGLHFFRQIEGNLMQSNLSRRFGWIFSTSLAIILLSLTAWTQAPPAAAPIATPGATATPGDPSPVNRSASGTAPSSQNPPGEASSTGDMQGPDSAEEPTANDQGGMFVFKKDVEEIILHATVLDEQRRLVPGLDRGAFSVLENGVPQPITSFRRQDVPVAMGIVVDNSGSMRDKRDEVNRAVMNLIRASNPEDEIFVVNFSQKYYLDQDFTSNANLLQTALHQVSSAGSTALYDAVVASAVHLANNPRLDKKVLLVITDGQDNMSQETLDEALRRLQQPNGPTLYAVGLMGNGLEGRGRTALMSMAQATGGVAYFPETLDQVGDTTGTIAHDIRSQYMIAYSPKNQNLKPDGSSVQVEAHAPGHGKLTVRTRSGYSRSAQSSTGQSSN
jgi:Ca-activated chloride channel family protein